MPAYEVCFACKGSGHEDRGDCIGTCSTCRGNCFLIARDHRGRFVKVES